MEKSFVLRGDVIAPLKEGRITYLPAGFVVVLDGKIDGVYSSLPEKARLLPLEDEGRKLLFPAFYDLHAHASQYAYHGLGEDCELLQWLNLHAFPEEARFASLAYAEKAYSRFVHDLLYSFTARASLFATRHPQATLLLMRKLEEAGLPCYVGLVSMDRNAPDNLREKDSEEGRRDLEEFLKGSRALSLEKPILTPRFAPSCDEALLSVLGEYARKDHLPVQSHLDENPSEIAWVRELFPERKSYSDVYDHYGLFGSSGPCLMAHCIYNTPEEIALLKKNGVMVVHCPESNLNVMSGMAPVRKYLDEGISVALGTDVSGGSTLSLRIAAEQAIQVSKMYCRYLDSKARPLTSEEAFLLLTEKGGSFFGKAGCFEKGYEADLLVYDDSDVSDLSRDSLKDRLERFLYLGETSRIVHKFVGGRQLF